MKGRSRRAKKSPERDELKGPAAGAVDPPNEGRAEGNLRMTTI